MVSIVIAKIYQMFIICPTLSDFHVINYFILTTNPIREKLSYPKLHN